MPTLANLIWLRKIEKSVENIRQENTENRIDKTEKYGKQNTKNKRNPLLSQISEDSTVDAFLIFLNQYFILLLLFLFLILLLSHDLHTVIFNLLYKYHIFFCKVLILLL